MSEKKIKFNAEATAPKGRILNASERSFFIVQMPVETYNGVQNFAKASLPIEGLIVIELDKEYSALITPQGMQIPVHLSHDRLTDLLANAIGVQDLTLITGPATHKQAPLISLKSSSDFIQNIEQKASPVKIENKPVEIHLFAFAKGTPDNRVPVHFTTDNIHYSYQDFSTKDWGYLKLKNKAVVSGHVGFWFDMDKKEFMERLNKAQTDGVGTLDLRNETRLKTTKDLGKSAIRDLDLRR